MQKKFINNPEKAVEEMVEGLAMSKPNQIRKLKGENVVVRKDAPLNKVALVSGGGSGHEPTHGGYVGEGMLDAAVSGDVFTSPTPDSIFEAVKAVASDKGVLLVIKNYSGDVMNFEMAEDMAEAEDIDVDHVVVNDDVAVDNEEERRGVAGTIFVHKIAGALAEQGKSLEEVKSIAEKVINNIRSKGVALYPCRVPTAEESTFKLEEDEMELGIGIHGEAGTKRTKVKSVDEIVDILLGDIVNDLPYKANDEVAVIVNGMGGTPLMELFVANRRVNEVLNDKGIKIYKTLVGNFMTSLEMTGLSLTLLKLDDELKRFLDQPTKVNLLR